MLRTPYFAIGALLLLFSTDYARAAVAYTNAWWWSGAGFEFGARYVDEGRFADPIKGHVLKTIDLEGAYVVPPFGDAHNHMAGTAQSVSEQALAAGVFYLMNPTILASAAPSLRRALQGPGHVDAVLSMGAITAPGGHPEPLYVDILGPRVYPDIKPEKFLGDAFHYVTAISDIGPVLDRLQSQQAEFIKIMVLNSENYTEGQDPAVHRGFKGLNPALVRPLVEEAHRRGLRVAAHIETAADFRVIVAAGVDEAAHMPGYYGAKGELERYVITPADAQAAAQARIVVVPTASLAADNNQGDAERLAEVQTMQRTNLERLKAAGVQILIGTDGKPGDALEEAAYLKRLGVLTPREAITALCEITPAWIFPDRRIGKLANGYEASFLTLRGDPTFDLSEAGAITRRVQQGIEIRLPKSRPTLAVTHAAVIGMVDEGVRRNQTILIAGNRILRMGNKTPIPAGVQILDAHGGYVIPGLWDMHVHVLTHSTEAARDAMLTSLLGAGVTGVRDMGSTMAQLQRFNAARDAKRGDGPEVIAAGPVINGPATRWSRPIEAHVSNPEEARRVVFEQIAAGSDFIKPYGGLDPITYEAVALAAHSKGLALSGHLPQAVDLRAAISVGQRSIEHMEVHLSKSCGSLSTAAADRWLSAYAGEGLAGREEQELALRRTRNQPECRAQLAALGRARIWWTPTLVLDFADRSDIGKDFERYAPVDGTEACNTMGSYIEKAPAGQRQRALQAELDDVRSLSRAGVHLLAGTDMPGPCSVPVVSLWQELGLLVRAGLTPYQALRTATVEPADYFGRPDAGRVGPGNVADLVILKSNPLERIDALRTVVAVIKGGRPVGRQ